jgi:hypothetical protein
MRAAAKRLAARLRRRVRWVSGPRIPRYLPPDKKGGKPSRFPGTGP